MVGDRQKMDQVPASTQIPWSLTASMAWMGGWLLHCLHGHPMGLGAAREGSRRLFPTPLNPQPPPLMRGDEMNMNQTPHISAKVENYSAP